jgi:hypothetical protein
MTSNQCRESGSFFDPWIRDGEKIQNRIPDEHPRSFLAKNRRRFIAGDFKAFLLYFFALIFFNKDPINNFGFCQVSTAIAAVAVTTAFRTLYLLMKTKELSDQQRMP